MFASPQRSFDAYRIKMSQDENLPIEEVEGRGPVSLPFASIWRQDWVFAQDRWNSAPLRGMHIDIKSGTHLSAKHPVPLNFPVQIDFWMKTKMQRNSISAQLALKIGDDDVHLPIDWAEGKWYTEPYEFEDSFRYYGKQKIRLVSQGMTDTSDLEPGNDEQQTYRATFSGILETDLPHPPVEGRIAKRIELAIADLAGVTLEDPIIVGSE